MSFEELRSIISDPPKSAHPPMCNGDLLIIIKLENNKEFVCRIGIGGYAEESSKENSKTALSVN